VNCGASVERPDALIVYKAVKRGSVQRDGTPYPSPLPETSSAHRLRFFCATCEREYLPVEAE
jgi:hypothetical protein